MERGNCAVKGNGRAHNVHFKVNSRYSLWKVPGKVYSNSDPNVFLAELFSGPKGRRAEPHNYRARIEIEKTMRLSFHGHRG